VGGWSAGVLWRWCHDALLVCAEGAAAPHAGMSLDLALQLALCMAGIAEAADVSCARCELHRPISFNAS
jgi:hypothetical protein